MFSSRLFILTARSLRLVKLWQFSRSYRPEILYRLQNVLTNKKIGLAVENIFYLRTPKIVLFNFLMYI